MRTTNRKDVLTTGDVAKACHVAPRTVSKWFDSGDLRGYRIPGSRDRRIPREQLLAFMRANGIPLEGLDGGTCRLLFVGSCLEPAQGDALRQNDRYDVRLAANGFEAGAMAQQFRPHAVLVAATPGAEEAVAICRNIKSSAAFGAAKVIAICPDLDRDRADALTHLGFDACIPLPFTTSQLVAAVESVTNLFY